MAFPRPTCTPCELVQLKIQPQGCKGWLHGAAARDVPYPCLALWHRSHRDGPAEDAFDLALSRLQFREPNYAGGTQLLCLIDNVNPMY